MRKIWCRAGVERFFRNSFLAFCAIAFCCAEAAEANAENSGGSGQKSSLLSRIRKNHRGTAVSERDSDYYLIVKSPDGRGSAFLVRLWEQPVIVTNAHVFLSMKDPEIVDINGRKYVPKEVLASKTRDLVIISYEGAEQEQRELLTAVGDAGAIPIDTGVVAYGNSLGDDVIVTQKGKLLGIGPDKIEVDAPFVPGNSGGPLFNMKGEVVGINSQIFSTSGGFMGLSFAIPIDLAMQIKDQLVKDGYVTRGYVGVYIQELSQELAETFGLKTPEGALVTKIEKDSPAEKAGLREGDVITALDGKKVTSSVSLPMLVSAMKPGDEATLTVIRDKKEKAIDITIGTNPNQDQGAGDQDAKTTPRLGLEVRPLTAEEAKTAETTGLLVANVTGAAAKAGVRKGDILVSANGKPLKSARDLANAAKEDQVLLLVQRDGGRIFIPIRTKTK